MLINSDRLLNCPVLSLHVGGMIAKTTEIVVDPNDLKVMAFRLEGPDIGKGAGEYLQENRIREYSSMGMVVDSLDDFVDADDVVSLKQVLDLNFSLIGMHVVTKKGTKLGKVSDFTVNTDGFMVQQLIVQRPIMKAFLDPELVVGRSEVIQISDKEITVRDEESKIRANATKEDFVPNFVNPFREPRLSTADNQTLDEPGTK